MVKRIILLIWVVVIIFPVAGLGWLYPGFMRQFNVIFRSNWTHVMAHALLFAVLIVIFLTVFAYKPGKQAIGASIFIILIVAALQEGLQALSQGFFPLGGALFDLGVDLLGGVVGYGIYVINHFYEDLGMSD